MNKEWLPILLGAIILATAFSAFPAVGTTLAALVTCASAAPCVGGNNTSIGPGVQGSSATGNGVYGTSSNIGVKGNSPNIGLEGQGGREGVRGSGPASTYGIGVAGDGFFGVLASGYYGVEAQSTNAYGYGVNATGGLAGVSASGNYIGVYGFGGPYGMSGTGDFDGVTGANRSGAAGTAVLAQGNTATGFLFRGNNSNQKNAFTVDDRGNVYALGRVSATKFVTRTALIVAQTTQSGAKVATYSAQGMTPSVEHIGEANLAGGFATVRFDPEFANTLARGNYMVFLTPQGPTQGSLYVTQKSPGGFVVRENQGGRSTAAFDYRIVGRPYSSRINAEVETQIGNAPAGPIHGPEMKKRELRTDSLHKTKLPKINM